MMTDAVRSKGGDEVVIRAPAKVNLGLRVLSKRRDGFHEIQTLFQAVSLFDHILLRRRRRGIRLHCRRFEGGGPDNLAWRAAEVVFRETGTGGGVEIHLDKRIPAGGGLGGGSSDAAAVLLGLCRLYGLKPDGADLSRWAGSLGSDVPFFLSVGAAVGRGRGELIEHLAGPSPPGAVLIFDPGFRSSTAEVYASHRVRRLTSRRDDLTILVRCWEKGDLAGLGRAMFNDLEQTVLLRHPSLAEVRTALLEKGALGARVSGSGSCLFGLFSDRRQARQAARELGADIHGRFVVARFLPPRLRWGVVKR